MKLLEIDHENSVTITGEALQIKEFRDIWKKDKKWTKTDAKRKLAYVVLYADYKSPYNQYTEAERETRLLKDLEFTKNSIKKDQDLLNAIEKYRELQRTYSLRFLEIARKVGHKLMAYLNNIDFDQVDTNGRPIHKPSDITKLINESSEVLESINKWIEKVLKEESTKGTTIRGGGEAGAFEDEAPWIINEVPVVKEEVVEQNITDDVTNK